MSAKEIPPFQQFESAIADLRAVRGSRVVKRALRSVPPLGPERVQISAVRVWLWKGGIQARAAIMLAKNISHEGRREMFLSIWAHSGREAAKRYLGFAEDTSNRREIKFVIPREDLTCLK